MRSWLGLRWLCEDIREWDIISRELLSGQTRHVRAPVQVHGSLLSVTFFLASRPILSAHSDGDVKLNGFLFKVFCIKGVVRNCC